MKSLAALLLFVAVRGVASQGTVTVCDATGNETCASQSRLCLNESGTQTCGNCLNGFIEFQVANTSCFNIENITFDLFNRTFLTRYRNGDNTSVLERLVRLKLRARFVSEWQSQFPYPPFDLAINQLAADLDSEVASRRGYNASAEPGDAVFPRFANATGRRAQTNTSPPPAVDWNAAGGVTSVKNQESCGCCWAVSVVGAVEGASFITNGFIESLSFQQLISCDTVKNEGCNGGYITSALNYAVANSFGGVTSDASYPFEDEGGTTTTTCSLSDKPLVVQTKGPQTVLAFNDDLSFAERVTTMKMAVARQPVTVTMSANCDTFQSYKGKVMTTDGGCRCQTQSCIDHAILMVGYNDSASTPYWLLKNSWGTGWGESGFFRVAQAQSGENWGLFGLMGQGILPTQAYNATPATPSTSAGGILWLWNSAMLVLISAACVWIG